MLASCRGAVVAISLVFHAVGLAAQPIGTTQQGFATFYGGPQDNTNPTVPSFGLVYGACGYGVLNQTEWPYWQATAIGPGNPLFTGGNMRGCGACILATCTSGCMAGATPVVVQVTDTCDSCTPLQLNIHALAFSKYFNMDLGIGQVNVAWQQVECTPPGDIKVKVTDFRPANGRFIALTLLEVAGNGIIAGIDIQSAGQTTWAPMVNDHGAVWQASNLGDTPFSLRITGSSQQQLIAVGAIPQLANGTYSTGVQFGDVRGATPPASPPAAVMSQPPSTSPVVTSASTRTPPVQAPQPPVASSQPPEMSIPTEQAIVPSPAASPSSLEESDVPAGPAPAPTTPSMPAAPGPALRRPARPAATAMRVTPAPSPSEEEPSASPVAAPGDSAAAAASPSDAPSPSITSPTTAPAPGPNGTTSLTLSSGLQGDAASATNGIINPAISVAAGRRLRRSAA